MSDYSPWFVRDRSFSSSKGVLVFLNEEQQTKLNKKSVFISARDDQHEFQFQSFKSIQVPLVRFHWYILKNCGFQMDDFLTITDFVDQKRIENEEKKAAALRFRGQLSLEIETEKMFQIRNCGHKKYNLVSAGDFQTCNKCKMRRCVKCDADLSFVGRLSEVARHFDVEIMKMQQIISLRNMLDFQVQCAGPEKHMETGEIQVSSLEDW